MLEVRVIHLIVKFRRLVFEIKGLWSAKPLFLVGYLAARLWLVISITKDKGCGNRRCAKVLFFWDHAVANMTQYFCIER